MTESLFAELKRYVGFGPEDEHALHSFHPVAQGEFQRIAEVFYDRILAHEGASKALRGGESTVGKLKVSLVEWMHRLLLGPWDEEYFELRCRIGRVHVRIALPQHYMFGAMNVLRRELQSLVDTADLVSTDRHITRTSVSRILDLELAIMLHTFREELLAQQSRIEQAAMAEKLAAVGTLTAGLSHEIRNPLNAAALQLEVLERRVNKLPEDTRPPLLQPLTLVRDEIRRLDRTLQDFLEFARPKKTVRLPISLEPMLLGVIELLSRQALARKVRLESAVGSGLTVLGDENRLRQVLMNLVLNAIDAAEPDGWVRVGSRQAAYGTTELWVEDSGTGVPAELRERIFEPFFTTKPTGSGLGLPIVHAIVTQHAGSIRVISAEGGGARFVITLPAPH